MDRNILFVGLGGMLGSMARYLVAYLFARASVGGFPYGTFAVNVAGCFAVGVIFGLSNRFEWLTPEWRFFLATGFCGGFTTFSSFAYENLMLFENRDYGTLALNTILSIVICFAAVFLGLLITRG